MQILKKDLRKGEIKVKINSKEDLWYLSHIITQGDKVEGSATRKIKIGEKGESVKKHYFVQILIEKIEFGHVLKLNGTTYTELEDIPKGSYQSINIEEGSILKIIKHWHKFQLDKLDESTKLSTKTLLVLFDREEALFAELNQIGFEIISKVSGDVQKKDERMQGKSFFPELIKLIKEQDERKDYDIIVLAAQGFWKDEFIKNNSDPNLKKKIVHANCDSVTYSGVNEVIRSKELQNAIHDQKSAQEMQKVEELLKEISKEGRYTYGIKETEQAAIIGAVKELMIVDSFIYEQEDFTQIDNIMKLVEQNNGDITIINSHYQAGKELHSLGGIGAITRYKLN